MMTIWVLPLCVLFAIRGSAGDEGWCTAGMHVHAGLQRCGRVGLLRTPADASERIAFSVFSSLSLPACPPPAEHARGTLQA